MKYLDNNGLLYVIKQIKTWLNGKVAKEEGKGLSTNDFTTAEKNKLKDLSNYTLPTASADTKGGIKVGAGLTMNGDVLSATGGGTADSVDWENVTNKPTKISEFTNDKGFKTESEIDTMITNKGYQTASDVETAITDKGYQTSAQVNTTITNKGYQTASDVNSIIAAKGYQTASEVETAITNRISSVMTYKGTVANYSDLPTNAKVGDTYNITNKSTYNKAGDNAAWNGTAWDVLSGTIDLSNYYTKTDITAITNDEIDTIFSTE